MRVGLVSPYDLGRPGGVQDQVIRLAGWLSDAGHDPLIVGPEPKVPRTQSCSERRESSPQTALQHRSSSTLVLVACSRGLSPVSTSSTCTNR